MAVVGAGAAGLYAALCARAPRPGGAGVRGPARSRPPATGRRRARGGAGDGRQRATASDRHRACRARRSGFGRGDPRARAPGACATCRRWGCRFDADDRRAPGARPGGRALGQAGGPCRRRCDRAASLAPARRWPSKRNRIAVLENARVRALWESDGRCRGVACGTAGRSGAARAVVLQLRGARRCGLARPTPGSQGTGLLLAHALGAAAGGHGVHAVPPDRGDQGARTGGAS